jgi:hypothetical protein
VSITGESASDVTAWRYDARHHDRIESRAVPEWEAVVYDAPDGVTRVGVQMDGYMVWLTQRQMADLFGRDSSVTARQIRKAVREGDLDPKAVSTEYAQVQPEGARADCTTGRRYLRETLR